MILNVEKLHWVLYLAKDSFDIREELKLDDDYTPESYLIPNFLEVQFENHPNCEVGEQIDIKVDRIGSYKGIVKKISTPKEVREEFDKNNTGFWEKLKNQYIDEEFRKACQEAEEMTFSSFSITIEDITVSEKHD